MKKFLKFLANNIPLLISALVVITITALYFLNESFNEWGREAFDVLMSDDDSRIKGWVSQYGLWGPVVILMIMVVQMFLFVIPNVLLMMIAILCYGPVWGSLLALTGVFAASTVGYKIGSNLGPHTVGKFVSTSTRTKIEDFVNEYGMGAIMITRLSSFSNDALGFVAGLLKMGYWRFIIATTTGITPLVILLAIFGRNGKIEKALIWIAAISLILLVIYIVVDKRRKKKRRSKQ